MRTGFLVILLVALGATAVSAQSIPAAVDAYRQATNARDLEAYVALFADDAIMVDVGRRFTGRSAIRPWAAREVMPHGETFAIRSVEATSPGYAKVLVNWYRWIVYYYFWYDDENRITMMSLQYREAGQTADEAVYGQLPAEAALYFDAVKSGSAEMLRQALVPEASVQVVDRNFNGVSEIQRFAETEVFGGTYRLIEVLTTGPDLVSVHLSFTPQNWSRPEPDAIYDFSLRDGRIATMNLQYKD